MTARNLDWCQPMGRHLVSKLHFTVDYESRGSLCSEKYEEADDTTLSQRWMSPEISPREVLFALVVKLSSQYLELLPDRELVLVWFRLCNDKRSVCVFRPVLVQYFGSLA